MGEVPLYHSCIIYQHLSPPSQLWRMFLRCVEDQKDDTIELHCYCTIVALFLTLLLYHTCIISSIVTVPYLHYSWHCCCTCIISRNNATMVQQLDWSPPSQIRRLFRKCVEDRDADTIESHCSCTILALFLNIHLCVLVYLVIYDSG